VLVVDAHALQPVDLLDLVDKIGGEILDALDRQDVVRRRIAVDDVVALLDDVAILKMDVLALRDQVLARLLVLVGRLDGDPALVLVVAANRTVPAISAMTAASFGRRASNNSATRGRPPVMSRVLALSVGMRR